jgi:signal transduction histidine kinase
VLGSGGRLAPEIQGEIVVLGDPALLSRLVDNLVGNAFKFSPPSEPVELVLRKVPEGAVLEVRDRGPGVPPEDRQAIFRRFARGSAAVTGASPPGLGLGLAFVSEVAGWHHGRVELESPPSGGSVFRVIIPVAPAGRA